MSPELIGILGVGAALFGFMWKLDNGMTQLSERVTALEIKVQTLENQMQLLISSLLNGRLQLIANAAKEQSGGEKKKKGTK